MQLRYDSLVLSSPKWPQFCFGAKKHPTFPAKSGTHFRLAERTGLPRAVIFRFYNLEHACTEFIVKNEIMKSAQHHIFKLKFYGYELLL